MGERGQGGVWRPTYQDHRTKEQKTSSVWWIWYPCRGKKRESSHSTRRSDAVRLLRRRLGEIGTGRFIGPDIEKTMFRDLKKMILDDYRANGRRSLDRLERSLEHIEDFFETDRALDITSDRVTAYVAHRQKPPGAEGEPQEAAGAASNATINRELAALKRMFRLAKRAGKVADCPYIALLHEANVRKGFFEWAEFRAVVSGLPQYLRPVVETAYVTGWRISSELLTRQRHHVDMVNGWLRLEPGETKNDEGRQFPLTAELRMVLERQFAMTRELEVTRGMVIPWLFHRNGRRIGSFRRTWLTACQGAGVPGKIPHDFRRTAVRNLERAGVPRSAAMAMVGHKTQSIYARYAIADESMLRDGAGRLAALHQHEADALKRRLEADPVSRSAGVVVPLVKAPVKARGIRPRE